MKLKKGEWFLLFFNLSYVFVFAFYYIKIKNFEFLWYVAVLVFFMVLIISTLKKSQFDYLILWGLSVWGFLHMAGGGIVVGDDVLYALQLIPIVSNGEYTILKFDQLVHFYGFFIATLVVYHLLKPYISENVNWKVIYFVVIMAGTGLGVLNEIVEFIAVVMVPETGVGGYANTSLDLVSNTLGALCASIFIHIRRKFL